MNEFDFASKHLGEYRVKGDEIVPKLCPFCTGGQHRDKYTFALNHQNHTYNCKRGSCGKQGHFSQLLREYGELPRYPEVYREYKRPKVSIRQAESAAEKYMGLRGIAPDTVSAFGVGQDDSGNIIFPFYRTKAEFSEKAPVFVKYRKPKKLQKGEPKMWREKDAEPILFGMHLCDTETPVLWVFEGEFDAMCGRQVSGGNCVSVPSGCEDFTWVETCEEWLHGFTTVIVFADNDAAGHRMLAAIANKLDCEVQRPDFSLYNGAKDANEILVMHGAGQLLEAMTSPRAIEIQGLLNLADVRQAEIDKMPRVMSGVPRLDEATGGMLMGDLSVWTGKRGEGKSTILTQILLQSVHEGTKVCAYSGEIPASRFKYIVNLQAAGSRYAKERKDYLTGGITQYVPREHLEKIEEWYNGKFWLYDNRNVDEDEAESILRLFELAYKRYDCRVFLVDNLMTVSTCKNDRDYYQMQADFAIKLRKLAEKLNVHIHLVVHPRKGEVQSSDSVGGLSTITNIACNVYSIRRATDEETDCNAWLAVLKNRAYGKLISIKMAYSPICRRFIQTESTETQFGWVDEQVDIYHGYNPFLED